MQELRFSYLGPRGTFTQQALGQIASEDEATHIPAADAPRAMRMVIEGEADYAVVPIENSVEGGINATLDYLAATPHLSIMAEVLVPITFTLAAREGTRLEDVTTISTHPAAWTQCRRWIMDNLPDAVFKPASSTAAGAEGLVGGGAAAGGATAGGAAAGGAGSAGTSKPAGDAAQAGASPAPDYQATLVSPLAAEQYGLTALATGVADNPDAVTRFVMIGRAGVVPEQTGADKTTLMVQLATDESGALLDMLEQFSARGINLSRIESRPVGDSLGRYAFSIDAEGHLFDERMQDLLAGLYRVCPRVTFLGSYPAADGRRIKASAGTSNEDFRSARSWVQALVERSRGSLG